MSLYKKFDFSESELKELEIMKEEIESIRTERQMADAGTGKLREI